jgi:hypothetical protein
VSRRQVSIDVVYTYLYRYINEWREPKKKIPLLLKKHFGCVGKKPVGNQSDFPLRRLLKLESRRAENAFDPNSLKKVQAGKWKVSVPDIGYRFGLIGTNAGVIESHLGDACVSTKCITAHL